MPKQVDHEQRRVEIVEATWRIIARGGFAAATMREIAAEAGFANGGLKHYFASKDELLVAAFQRTFYRINERAAIATGRTSGLDAIRSLCMEMLPLDEERRVESRVTVAFWDRAASNRVLMKLHADSHAIWRNFFEQQLDTARATGELRDDVATALIVDELLWLTTGLQVVPLLDAKTTPAVNQVRIIDSVLDRVRAAHRLPVAAS
ncbi:TetR/AcrR family transcriptional regulator [soil metagenome]